MVQVVKALWAYIKEKDLQMPQDRRKIRVDETLGTLFTHPLGGSATSAATREPFEAENHNAVCMKGT